MERKHYLVGPGCRSEGILVKLGERDKDRSALVELGEIVVIKPCSADVADIADDIEIEIFKKKTKKTKNKQ